MQYLSKDGLFVDEDYVNDTCYMAIPSCRLPQKAMRVEGRGPQTPPKTKQERIREINTKLTSKSDAKCHGTLKRTGKYNFSIF